MPTETTPDLVQRYYTTVCVSVLPGGILLKIRWALLAINTEETCRLMLATVARDIESGANIRARAMAGPPVHLH